MSGILFLQKLCLCFALSATQSRLSTEPRKLFFLLLSVTFLLGANPLPVQAQATSPSPTANNPGSSINIQEVRAQPANAPLAGSTNVSAGAIPAIPALTVTANQQGGQDYTVTLQILGLMTVLTLLPSFVIMMTAFTRIIVVFAILRHAIGLQQTPSNQILIGMALFLTLFVMMPVLQQVNESAVQPYINNQMTSYEALQEAAGPFRGFMMEQTRESDLDLFVRLSNDKTITDLSEVPFFVLVPAFMTSELKSAFQIGFTLFIPFLVIDMVVASVLMAMGMMMLSPIIISLPFKIMLFVLVDGWAMVIGSLAASFGT